MDGPASSPRLSEATLDQMRPGVAMPGYDRRGLAAGIVHLGLGAFVRGHLALYTDDVLAIEPGGWGIAGVSLKRPDQRDRLAPQDGLYTTLQRDGRGTRARIIGLPSARHRGTGGASGAAGDDGRCVLPHCQSDGDGEGLCPQSRNRPA